MHCYSGNRRRTHGMVLRLSALLVLALSIDAQDDQGGVGSCGPVYVSFVMVGRVDSLRGDYVGRLRNSVQFIQALCKAHGVRAEIVIVEWNPLPGWDSCLLYTSPSPRDKRQSRMPSSA